VLLIGAPFSLEHRRGMLRMLEVLCAAVGAYSGAKRPPNPI
jgi:hypothetical protein